MENQEANKAIPAQDVTIMIVAGIGSFSFIVAAVILFVIYKHFTNKSKSSVIHPPFHRVCEFSQLNLICEPIELHGIPFQKLTS